MPDTLAACRVCLAVDVRLLTIAGSLQLVYEKITNNALHADGKPVVACYICHAQLDKCRKLMLTSEQAENVLDAILHRHSEITKESIGIIDREAHGLCGSLLHCGAVHYNSDLPYPIVVKTELDSDASTESVRIKVESDKDPLPICNIDDMKWDSDLEDPITLLQPYDIDIETTEHAEQGADSASGSCKGKPTKKGTNTKRQCKSRNSNIRSARGPYECDMCQRRFKNSEPLKMHYRTHTGEKPYQCDVCNYRFSVKNNLMRHMKTHTGEKPYLCDICQRGFSRKNHLVGHARTHASEKRSTLYSCEVCARSLSSKSNLVEHMKTHTGENPFQCDVCLRRFSRKCNLEEHMATHTSEKPFQCNLCQQNFGHKNALNRHFRIHTGEKPYGCGVCQRRFRVRRHLVDHSRTHAS
ncbi:zinc finger protein 84-like [Plodia interpunctella]|uniref:zinc finger protein 84-like n=1 Tax=Plodia interpunctella TaxID=58824 RepID=UPI002367829E|nr:zinc finger protein 84-like [Plodia interpunctella]